MKRVEILTAREAAELIEDGDVVTVSSSSGLGCPDAVLRGIGQRFEQTQAPRALTSVHPIAAGDMYGIRGIDHLARPGLLKRVVAGSYPSGPSSAEPPAIWAMIEHEQVEAYNFPSGTLFQMHRAVAAHQPGVLTKVGQGTFIDPREGGGRMNETTPADIVELHTVDDQEWLFFRSIVPDVAIIRATTADEFGNLTFEDEGSPLGALDLAYASHNNGGLVIAQVKRMASGRSLDPQKVRVPGILVDAVVIDPDQMQTTHTHYDPAISGQLRRPLADLPPVAYSLEKVMARRAATELAAGETVNLGFGVSALVPHVLNEEGHGTAVSWVLEQGAVGGIPLLDFAFGCSQNPDAIMQSADQFTLLQGGGFSHSLLSFLEIDAHGNVNVHHLPHRRHVTAGVGGFADITAAAPEIVFVGSFTAGRRQIDVGADGLGIVADGPHTKLVPEVAAVTFNGQLALSRGQRVTYVTERCVMQLRPEGITVTEIAPGVDLDRDVLARSAFGLLVSDDLRLMDRALFREGAMGLTLPEHPGHGRLARRAATTEGSGR
ncbi:acyl CoA:acetate/3-ketoacid CoA transferase [Occultella glacieicola]|uniref:Acyl CoA:acetate/3-ketoacid CoA transferase n=1 Tax=Occultella glacieicola TaxID=2518684 RepID=A0ABY2E1S0_9MICO|nr:CoA-transferase [Occultella glacieicola]TDE89489.1 acyl CoA:acetate/3-ketoacid CoA transferase [Occultella glacieicola]